MGGPRANYILVEQGQTYVFTDKYGGEGIPDFMMRGELDVLTWLRSVAQRDNTLYDSVYAEGALLVNGDARLLVAGFLRWGAERRESDPFANLRDYHYFHRYSDLQAGFFELASYVWPDWTLRLAKKNSFGVQECLVIDEQQMAFIVPDKKKARNPQKKPVRENFLSLLSGVMPQVEYQNLLFTISRTPS